MCSQLEVHEQDVHDRTGCDAFILCRLAALDNVRLVSISARMVRFEGDCR